MGELPRTRSQADARAAVALGSAVPEAAGTREEEALAAAVATGTRVEGVSAAAAAILAVAVLREIGKI
jgi:hypothetical protein